MFGVLIVQVPGHFSKQIHQCCRFVRNKHLSPVMRKPTFWFLTWSDTNQAVQLQIIARGLKFRI